MTVDADDSVIVVVGERRLVGPQMSSSHVTTDADVAAAVVDDRWCCMLSAGLQDYSCGRRIRWTVRLCMRRTVAADGAAEMLEVEVYWAQF